jgi:hypothetical protein
MPAFTHPLGGLVVTVERDDQEIDRRVHPTGIEPFA